jgi:hypothetical protein
MTENLIEQYRRQGEARERGRILALLERTPFIWTGDKKSLTLGRDELIALIDGNPEDLDIRLELALADRRLANGR